MRASRRNLVLLGAAALATAIPTVAAWRQLLRYDAVPIVPVESVACAKIDFAISDVRGFETPPENALGVERERRRVIVVRKEPLSPAATGRPGDEKPVEPWAAAARGNRFFVLDAADGRVHVYEGTDHVAVHPLLQPGKRELAIDDEGRLLATDPSRNAVCRFTTGFARDSSFGTSGCAPAEAPIGIAAVAGGRVLVSSDLGFAIVFDASGRELHRRRLMGVVGRLGRGPRGGAVMADRPTGRLWLLDADGREIGRAGASRVDPVLMTDARGADVAGRTLWLTNPWFTCRYTLPESWR